MAQLLLGIDVGTTGTKSMVIDSKGNILAAAYKGYPTFNDKIGWVEQNAEDWWNAVVETVRKCTENAGIRKSIKALGLSTQGGSLVPVDRNGHPLRRVIVWMDKRAAEQREFFEKNVPTDYFYNTSGWKLSSSLNAVQIKWIKDNEKEVFDNTYKFLSTTDYIAYKLTGRYVIDPSNAGITQLLNLKTRDWDEKILGLLGIDPGKLPEVADSGEAIGCLKDEAAKELNLSKDVIVASGGHDQYCVALGAGAVNEGDVLLATGTAWVALGVFNEPKFDTKNYLGLSIHTVKEKWGLLGSVAAGGMSLEWYRKNFGEKIQMQDGCINYESFKEIDKKAEEKPIGSNGLMFYPHFNGSGCPGWGFNNKGTLLGLDLSHDRYDIARAVMEGVAFDAVWLLDILTAQTAKINKLKMLGGATKSRLWTQIIADITGVPVIVPKSADIACIGAGILAGVGSDVFPNAEEGYNMISKEEQEILPVDKNVQVYGELFSKYKNRFEHLKNYYKI